MIRAVIFDFDGTILDTESVWYESYRDTLASHGVELPLPLFKQGIGTYDDTMLRYIREQLGTEEALEAVKEASNKLHRERTDSLQPRDGVVAYLEEARKLGLKIGLATSSPLSWVEPFLEKHGLRGYFEAVCTSNDVEKVKPDPALYRLAVKRLGVEPAEAVAFEDSVNGARAAVAAGVRCVIVPNPMTSDLPFEQHDVRLAEFSDVPLQELLRQIEFSSPK